jgi:hypothetical protein
LFVLIPHNIVEGKRLVGVPSHQKLETKNGQILWFGACVRFHASGAIDHFDGRAIKAYIFRLQVLGHFSFGRDEDPDSDLLDISHQFEPF